MDICRIVAKVCGYFLRFPKANQVAITQFIISIVSSCPEQQKPIVWKSHKYDGCTRLKGGGTGMEADTFEACEARVRGSLGCG